jgi:hypothetical protein
MMRCLLVFDMRKREIIMILMNVTSHVCVFSLQLLMFGCPVIIFSIMFFV